ncbi:hypothetical protein [Dictyobacter kobayashii]|uniref:Uncharacterized protein n=1 Tax=Dictyobacter kobayashii TaxID=2014872 RepID=A0A402AWT4_9CHLR|nr:hypothetical protein [Dictyobacter kobayashii]GCE23536.1 hypothetical protein KDK_73360 [Dictyobacter kobayashii]
MKFLDHVRGEVRILGWLLFIIPVAIMLAFALLAMMMFVGHVNRDFTAAMLIAGLEACGPLTLGLLMATMAIQDPALELQLTLPVRYRVTMFLRFFLIVVWTMLVECLATLLLHAILPWVLPKDLLASQLTWLAPTIWFGASGTILALLLRNRATCGAVLGFLWLIELAFHGYFAAQAWTQPWFLFATLYTPTANFWLTNRLELLATALLLFIVSWWYLGHSEWRFYGEDNS